MLATTVLLHPFVSASLSGCQIARFRLVGSLLRVGLGQKSREGGGRALTPGGPRWQESVSIKPDKVICERGLARGEAPTPHLSSLKTHGLST